MLGHSRRARYKYIRCARSADVFPCEPCVFPAPEFDQNPTVSYLTTPEAMHAAAGPGGSRFGKQGEQIKE